MAQALKASFKERIKDVDWMAPSTVEAALHKVELLGYKIAHPEHMLNDSRMSEDWGAVSFYISL